jgi:hypothetical protein
MEQQGQRSYGVKRGGSIKARTKTSTMRKFKRTTCREDGNNTAKWCEIPIPMTSVDSSVVLMFHARMGVSKANFCPLRPFVHERVITCSASTQRSVSERAWMENAQLTTRAYASCDAVHDVQATTRSMTNPSELSAAAASSKIRTCHRTLTIIGRMCVWWCAMYSRPSTPPRSPPSLLRSAHCLTRPNPRQFAAAARRPPRHGVPIHATRVPSTRTLHAKDDAHTSAIKADHHIHIGTADAIIRIRRSTHHGDDVVDSRHHRIHRITCHLIERIQCHRVIESLTHHADDSSTTESVDGYRSDARQYRYVRATSAIFACRSCYAACVLQLILLVLPSCYVRHLMCAPCR